MQADCAGLTAADLSASQGDPDEVGGGRGDDESTLYRTGVKGCGHD